MKAEQQEYLNLVGKSRLGKSVNTLLGLVEGIAMDGEIYSKEVSLHKYMVL